MQTISIFRPRRRVYSKRYCLPNQIFENFMTMIDYIMTKEDEKCKYKLNFGQKLILVKFICARRGIAVKFEINLFLKIVCGFFETL